MQCTHNGNTRSQFMVQILNNIKAHFTMFTYGRKFLISNPTDLVDPLIFTNPDNY